jgi:hypothetical protein
MNHHQQRAVQTSELDQSKRRTKWQSKKHKNFMGRVRVLILWHLKISKSNDWNSWCGLHHASLFGVLLQRRNKIGWIVCVMLASLLAGCLMQMLRVWEAGSRGLPALVAPSLQEACMQPRA